VGRAESKSTQHFQRNSNSSNADKLPGSSSSFHVFASSHQIFIKVVRYEIEKKNENKNLQTFKDYKYNFQVFSRFIGISCIYVELFFGEFEHLESG
jgi:hypothetical protein